MAPLPKRRHSSRRSGKRWAARKINLPTLVACPQCGAMRLPHRLCHNCGFYDGREVRLKREKTKKK